MAIDADDPSWTKQTDRIDAKFVFIYRDSETSILTLSDDERRVIMHALGFSKSRRRWSNGNCFLGEDATCNDLVGKGLMVASMVLDGSREVPWSYYVTDDGIKAANLWHRVRKADMRSGDVDVPEWM